MGFLNVRIVAPQKQVNPDRHRDLAHASVLTRETKRKRERGSERERGSKVGRWF